MMASPSDSPPQDEESSQSHPSPTPTPTPTPTSTPEPTSSLCNDQNPQILETPNQKNSSEIEEEQNLQKSPQCSENQPPTLDEEEQEAEEDLQSPQGMASSFPVPPSAIDLPPSITDAHVSVTSPNHPFRRSSFNKRKKGKPNVKKQQAIEKKYLTLMAKLNPIPFIPLKLLDFEKHERLLRRLGLWDFVHIDFDRNVRKDLIAQLVASYDPKLRCSYVNGVRIMVNRADLGRAFKLPVKKEKGGAIFVEGAEMDLESLSEDSVGFIEGFVSNWVLLHEDTWMMPSEVLNWMKVIKDEQPEKVDWAGLFWFMVEKELTQGEQLEECYYASHLQYLIKAQHEEVLVSNEPEKVDLDGDEKEEEEGGNDSDVKVGGNNEGQEDEGVESEGLNVELTLGKDGGEKEDSGEDKEKVEDAEMMNVDEANEVEDDEKQQQWVLDGKNNVGEHFLQRCNMEGAREFEGFESKNDGDDDFEEVRGEEEVDDAFDIGPNGDDFDTDGLTGNFLQAMETNQMAYGSQEEIHDQSAMELLASRSNMQHMDLAGPSFYGNGGKREIEHEEDMSHHSLNGSNKRLRIDEGRWDNKPSDFGTCMEQIHQLMTRARTMYEAKEQAEEQSNMNQQILLNEVQKRDSVIEHLHKTRLEELHKREEEILRLERELYVMGNLLNGYKTALKETQKAFVEYRQHCPLPEEPIYKDVGPGGLMLSTAEIERLRLVREEEYRRDCLMLEQKAKEAEEEYASQFAAFLQKVHVLDERLMGLENEMKQIKELYGNGKRSEAEQPVSENPECPTTE